MTIRDVTFPKDLFLTRYGHHKLIKVFSMKSFYFVNKYFRVSLFDCLCFDWPRSSERDIGSQSLLI